MNITRQSISPLWPLQTILAHRDWSIKRSGLLAASFPSFAWLILLSPTHLSFIPCHFFGLTVLPVSSALCLSLSTYFQNRFFPHQQDNCYIVCVSTFSYLCCSTEEQTVLWSSRIGASTDTVVGMTQHPQGQGGRDFIFTSIEVHGWQAHCKENKRKRDYSWKLSAKHVPEGSMLKPILPVWTSVCSRSSEVQ